MCRWRRVRTMCRGGGQTDVCALLRLLLQRIDQLEKSNVSSSKKLTTGLDILSDSVNQLWGDLSDAVKTLSGGITYACSLQHATALLLCTLCPARQGNDLRMLKSGSEN